jgi:hypothetical protein
MRKFFVQFWITVFDTANFVFINPSLHQSITASNHQLPQRTSFHLGIVIIFFDDTLNIVQKSIIAQITTSFKLLKAFVTNNFWYSPKLKLNHAGNFKYAGQLKLKHAGHVKCAGQLKHAGQKLMIPPILNSFRKFKQFKQFV